MTPPAEPVFRLLTNMQYVTVELPGAQSRLRLDAHAVLLEDQERYYGGVGAAVSRYTVRLFGPDPAWPVATYWTDVSPFGYDAVAAQSRHLLLSDSEGARPLFVGYRITLPDGTVLSTMSADEERPLDVVDFDGHMDSDRMDAMWETLRERAIRYWTPPYAPVLQHAQADQLRALLRPAADRRDLAPVVAEQGKGYAMWCRVCHPDTAVADVTLYATAAARGAAATAHTVKTGHRAWLVYDLPVLERSRG